MPTAAPAANTGEIWTRLIAMSSGRSQKSLLSKLTLDQVTQTTATISAPHECFELAQASEADIESALVNIVGRRLKVEIIDSGASTPASTAGTPASADTAAAQSMSQVESNPLIKRATELFGARIVSVQPRKPAVSAPAPIAAPIPVASPSAQITDSETETQGDD